MTINLNDLTGLTEQQIQFVETIRANVTSQLESQMQVNAAAAAAQREITLTNARLQCVQIATTTLANNALTKPADESDVTAEMINTFAASLMSYVAAS